MKVPSKRTQRVAELIQRRLAQVIQRECKDPRLPAWITISAVEVSPDFSFAKVYFTVLNADPLETLTALNAVSSFLRAQLAKSLTIRIVPQLQFAYDESLEYGRKMQSIINQANMGDDESDKT
jgi:ribosome-binding factor A